MVTEGEGDAAGAHAEAKSIATPQEIAQVTLDLADEEMLEQMEEEALERGEDWDSDEEREHLKRLKAEQKKKLMQKMKLGGMKAFGDEGEKVKDFKAKLLNDRKKKMKGIGAFGALGKTDGDSVVYSRNSCFYSCFFVLSMIQNNAREFNCFGIGDTWCISD